MSKKTVSVFGLGFMGLPSALLMAKSGHKVFGYDISEEVIESLDSEKLLFEEKGLEELFTEVKKGGSFTPLARPQKADVFIIAVPTPLDTSGRRAELGCVKQAAGEVSKLLGRGGLVILESTVPPSTTRSVVLPILEESSLSCGRDFHLVYAPERAVPGNTLYEITHNNRVIGGYDKKSAEKAAELYSSFCKGELSVTDLETAETIKLMENTYRDINIAMANEFALIADQNGINIWQAIELANKHPRVNILKPGPGVGGHCIAIDPWFLTEKEGKSGIIALARTINDAMPHNVLKTVKEMLKGVKSPVIAALGAAYKADVDDTRMSPAVKFIKLAEEAGFTIKTHDPHVKSFKYPLYPLNEAVTGADILVLLTDHFFYKSLDPAHIAPQMRTPCLLDTRNALPHNLWERHGFKVRLLGNGLK